MASHHYIQALGRLLSVTSFPELGLTRMFLLLERLGNPHLAYKTFHVAGTNGKGSVVTYVESILNAGGLRCGSYISPHLSSARERIRLNQTMIDEEMFCYCESEVDKIARDLDIYPTFFERMTAMGFLAFAESKIDVAVVEVGLGGRLDATNVIQPCVTGITRIGLDHTEFLGNTLAEIAAEKAGIIKPMVPCVIGPQAPEVLEVIQMRANFVGASIIQTNFWARPKARLNKCLVAPSRKKGYSTTTYQTENIAIATRMVESSGMVSNIDAYAKGIAEAQWPARLELISRNPFVLLDGAHNPNGLEALLSSLGVFGLSSSSGLVFVLGFTKGHDVAAMAQILLQSEFRPTLCIITKARAPRSRLASEVAIEFQRLGLEYKVIDGPMNALEEAKKFGPVVVAGSLYLVGEIRAGILQSPTDPELPNY